MTKIVTKKESHLGRKIRANIAYFLKEWQALNYDKIKIILESNVMLYFDSLVFVR